MAKSIRSKSKLRAKSTKRVGEFAKYVDGRNKRISEKMEAHMKEQKDALIAAKKAAIEAGEDVPEEEAATEGSMEVDDKDKKVSTSGWRDSRKQIYKKKNISRKKNKSTHY